MQNIMTRKETIDRYIDSFLKGRSQNAIDRFRSKAEHLQYASIMQWRRRMRKMENTPKSTREILETLRRAVSLIENAPEISDTDLQAIEAELDTLRRAAAECHERTRTRRISELEEQQRRINEQLEQLKGNGF